ncbi:MAG: DUF115 domain-containing protein [Treponema sp.]|nr:DUF115 domain-containing protein [Treponema sp.]MCL2237047.1 DUF115 domain-containing protein [Treponema sp.]
MNKTRYTFEKSKSEELVPAIINENKNPSPLHSMIDPKKEAQRLIAANGKGGFTVLLGLGGGYASEAALELDSSFVLVIDFDKESVEKLLAAKDYSRLLKNERFCLLTDPSNNETLDFILENYKPALHGGLKMIPLRTRTEHDINNFENAAKAVQQALDIVTGDYSVQAHFGKRWFSNIIRNIKFYEEKANNKLTENILKNKTEEAAIVAAGPSLDCQINSLKKLKSRGVFIICTDTALGALCSNNIEADAVVSIDCQHISCNHFAGINLSKKIPLFLDIASPPPLSRFDSFSPVLCSSGHPLARYIGEVWHPFPHLDTSGGNVTYACLSLAETLGAKRITLFGADFSYIGASSYARGTYVYPYFSNRQIRTSSLEAKFSSFLYRSAFLAPENEEQTYRETSSLRFYRNKMEEKISAMEAQVFCEKGFGAPIALKKNNQPPRTSAKREEKHDAPKTTIGGIEFLSEYKNDIAALPQAKEKENYFFRLNLKEKRIFTTLLPLAAFIRKKNADFDSCETIETVKRFCIGEIEKVLE